jgi:DNA replication and repair protein RecF
MYLKHISLTNYRAFSRLDMELPRRILLLVGDNAQGKTSFMEAIYYLATFTSFQAQYDRQLISFMVNQEDLAVARIVADYERGDRMHRMEVRLIQENNHAGNGRFRKEILLDGVKKTAYEAIGHFNAVIFMPQMTRIIEGSPDDRRRYLNLFISQASPQYATQLSEYNQILSQRNALLKQLAERRSDTEQLVYWDELLVSRGAELILARIQAINEIEQLAVRIHNRLTNSKEILRLVYCPSYDPYPQPEGQFALPMQTQVTRQGISLQQIQKGFARSLETLHDEEIFRGVTTIGPHRDELRFLGNGIDLGDFGSRGQIRTTLLSLKLAEVEWLKEKTSFWPVLLLDEMMAELDQQRRLDLMDYLEECEQVILTTTDLDLFSNQFVQKNSTWYLKAGMVSTEQVH